MKLKLLKVGILLTVGTCLAAGALAQSESQRLNARLVEAFQKGDLDGAIPIAEEIVAVERRTVPQSTRNLTNALENLAQVKLDRVKRSMAELRDTTLALDKAKSLAVLLSKDAEETESHFREALELSSRSNPDLAQAVNLRSKLAWLTYNYIPAETSPTFGFDKDSRDKIELRQRAVHTRRYDESRRLYSEASKIAEQSGNETAWLGADFNLAEFEVAMGNFEAAVPLYSRIISQAERLLPSRSPELIAPYEAFLKVLVATGQEEMAFDLLSKIVAITKRSSDYPKVMLNLTQRAERAFAPVNSKRVEEESKKLKSEAELAGRSVVARAATTVDALEAALEKSVDGRQYYETAAAKGIRLVKAIVRVELSESGKATTVEAYTTDRFLKDTVERAVRDWSFRPFLLDGKATRLKGYVEVSVLTN